MDYSEWYKRIAAPFRRNAGARFLEMLDKLLVVGFVAAYAVLLAVLLATGDSRLLGAIVVPGATYAIARAVRTLVNRPRPYEACDIDPLIKKDTHGKSMPSLHMTCAAIIAIACFQVWPVGGSVLFCACICIAFTRIVGGVHYPTDIVASIALAVLCGAIGFSVL